MGKGNINVDFIMIDIIKVFCCRRGFVDLEINVDVKQVVGDYLREILYTK